MSLMQLLKRSTDWQFLTIITIAAGFIYNSWPLGYILNPPVAHALASNLEGVHQPYNWVFIGGDVISSVMLIAVCAYLIKRYAKGRAWLKIVTISSVLFSIFTIVDAALPLKCVAVTEDCPSFTHDPLLFVHGVVSILASVFLFVAIFYLWRQLPRSWYLQTILVGYILFGIFSLIDALTPGKGVLSQHFYITLCSVCIAVIPFTVKKSMDANKPHTLQKATSLSA
jgi:hypothetical protein